MTGWKQAYTLDRRCPVLVELAIPDDARLRHIPRYGSTRDIWTCDRAMVVSITSLDGRHTLRKAVSMKSPDFIYEVGKEAVAERDRGLGDTPGIYFFKTKEQTLEYEY